VGTIVNTPLRSITFILAEVRIGSWSCHNASAEGRSRLSPLQSVNQHRMTTPKPTTIKCMILLVNS
jgi:hypothetical protein